MKRKQVCLKVIEIPVDKRAKHPEPPNDILPKHEFTMAIVSPKGAGKTTLICNLLNFYKKYFHNIIIFSPTLNNDEKWEWVKKQPLLTENDPLIELIEELKQENYQFKDNPIVGKVNDDEEGEIPDIKKDKHFTGLIPEDQFILDYTETQLHEMLNEQNKVIHFLKQNGKPKHIANRILFLFDDPVGSGLFSDKKHNIFKKFNSNHRHFSASMIVASQGYKEIPVLIRTNFSCLIIFEIASEREQEVIYEEYSMGLKLKEWIEVYEYCTAGSQYDFMFYNLQKPKPLRIMKNFNEIITVNKNC